MKFYSYLMPLVFFFVLNSFAAGLTWYYLVSNLVTMGQQAITRRFVDDDKVRAKLEANKIKNKDKKPSGFSARLADAMKAAQERDAPNQAGRPRRQEPGGHHRRRPGARHRCRRRNDSKKVAQNAPLIIFFWFAELLAPAAHLAAGLFWSCGTKFGNTQFAI